MSTVSVAIATKKVGFWILTDFKRSRLGIPAELAEALV
jgi:hypothetical protein